MTDKDELRAFEGFKFNLGEIVTTAAHEGYGAGSRLLVVSRILEQTTSGIHRNYVLSHYRLGDAVRSMMHEIELAAVTEK